MPTRTPHNEAGRSKIAKTVIMPGDPLRSKFIAENFLTDAELVNNVRGIQGYTGKWHDVPVTVMASGMGMPSIGIYSWELFNYYDVDNIIRAGSAGALQDDLELMDIVVGMGACTTSNYINNFGLPGTFAPIANYSLMNAAIQSAYEKDIPVKVGNIISDDNFYSLPGTDRNEIWKRMGVLAVEMEAAALYANAAQARKRALCICTISDHIYRHEALDPQQRQIGFTKMIEIALDTAEKMSYLK